MCMVTLWGELNALIFDRSSTGDVLVMIHLIAYIYFFFFSSILHQNTSTILPVSLHRRKYMLITNRSTLHHPITCDHLIRIWYFDIQICNLYFKKLIELWDWTLLVSLPVSFKRTFMHVTRPHNNFKLV